MRIISSNDVEYVDVPYEYIRLHITPQEKRSNRLGGNVAFSYCGIFATSVYDKSNTVILGMYDDVETARKVLSQMISEYSIGSKVYRLPDRENCNRLLASY